MSLHSEKISQGVNVLMVIITRWNAFDERIAVRDMFQSYSKESRQIYQLVFLFNWNEEVPLEDLAKIQTESRRYNDLLIPLVEDNYHSVGLKLLSSFYWINKIKSKFKNLKWIIKADDDILANITMLDDYLTNDNTMNSAIHCHLAKNRDVETFRGYKSKW